MPKTRPKPSRSAGSRRTTPAATDEGIGLVQNGPILAGVRVVAWSTQAETAKIFGCTTRWLQKLEDRGLPAEGRRGTTRYPWPHVTVWWESWRELQATEKHAPARLSLELAFRLHAQRNAVEEAEIQARMDRDPLFREYIEAGEAEDFKREARAIAKLRARDPASFAGMTD